MSRELKAFERRAGGGTTYADRTSIFDRWWPASQANIDPTLGHFGFRSKFEGTYRAAKLAADESPLPYALGLAQKESIPPGLIPEEIQREQKPALLASLCYQLQLLQGDKPFYLACRDAGELLEVPYRTACEWLCGFYREDSPNRILQLIKKGSYASKFCNEYRFIGQKS